MSQNEPRDGSRPVDALDALRLLPHDGAEVIANAVNASDSPEWAMHVRGYGDHPDGWSAVVTRVVEAADPAADGTEPVAPGDEAARARAHAFEAWIAYETTAMEHDWPATNEHTDAASTLAGAMAPWFAATDPGSGGQTGTPGANGGAADGSEQST